ncbi:hypothetical protein [Metasolibacillus sp.]|uniref:hypothetical protein n=1 Tax=Metasolibacillus sp. TaxID=2703680 RepID=UPI0025EACACC|nr:hypothetical protein [Metasolibacillus sp.]MCT6922800.1 hypothetical protein [Metasolibacillus sp.]MCT6938861.1 hypothetical protein [Metasolibacillus sp.]
MENHVRVDGKWLNFDDLVESMNAELCAEIYSIEAFDNDQEFVEFYTQLAFKEDPSFIEALRYRFKVDVKEVDPYEAILVIQENFGLSSNKVEWEHESFLNLLAENAPEDYQKYLFYKHLYQRQNLELEYEAGEEYGIPSAKVGDVLVVEEKIDFQNEQQQNPVKKKNNDHEYDR